MEIDQEKRIRLNRKLILVILALLIVFGLIQSGMTGTALFLIYKDTRLLKAAQDTRLLKAAQDCTEGILIQGGEDNDPISRERRDHVKNVSNQFLLINKMYFSLFR